MKFVRSIFQTTWLVLIFSACCCFPPSYKFEGEWVELINSPEIVHTIQHFMAYLRHEKHLRLEDSRVFYTDTINTVRMEFTSQDVLEVREARFLIVDVVEGLLAELNKNPVIAPQFVKYPLTPDQLEIYINFESFHGIFVDPYYVGYVMLENGTTHFWAFDVKENGRNIWDYRVEPYEKSREFTVYEREAEDLFEKTTEVAHPLILKEQYVTPVKEVHRYFSAYRQHYLFEN